MKERWSVRETQSERERETDRQRRRSCDRRGHGLKKRRLISRGEEEVAEREVGCENQVT